MHLIESAVLSLTTTALSKAKAIVETSVYYKINYQITAIVETAV